MEKEPRFMPEDETKLQSRRGGYLSSASRKGEMRKDADGKWMAVDAPHGEKILERAKEEMEQELAKRIIPGPDTKGAEEKKPETKEEFSQELKNAYFEYQDLARKMKRRWMPNRPLEEEWVKAKEKYHGILVKKSDVSEKGKKFFLPSETVPEGGPKVYNLERLEKLVSVELMLQREYEEKKVWLESKANEGLLKKLWQGYSKLSKSTKMTIGVGVATGAFVFTGGTAGFLAVGGYAGARAIRSLVGGFVAGALYKGLDKWLTPYVDKTAKKKIEIFKEKQAEELKDTRLSTIQSRLLLAKENVIREHAKRERLKKRINIEKALVAGATGIEVSLLSAPLYESAMSAVLSGGEEGSVAETVEKTAENTAVVGRGGNLWIASRSITGDKMSELWSNPKSGAVIGGRFYHISEIDHVHPEAKVEIVGDKLLVTGEGMGIEQPPSSASHPHILSETDEPVAETPPQRPFEHLPVEKAETETAPTFQELESGNDGVVAGAEKFVSERLASHGIDYGYYEQIKDSKVKDLLKIRKGTFWDLFRHLNDETAGRVDIFAEWKLAVLVKTELKNLLPLVEDKTIDEAIKFVAHNRHLIK